MVLLTLLNEVIIRDMFSGKADRTLSCILWFMGTIFPAGNLIALDSVPNHLSHPVDDYPEQMMVIPQIKGRQHPGTNLNLAPWNQAAVLTGLMENKGKSIANETTWIYLFYDSSSLWLAFRCEGQGASQLKTEITEHDGNVWRDDSVEVLIDPDHEHKDYYQFAVNSAGVIYDAFGKDRKWNSGIGVVTSTDEKGWTALLNINYSCLGVKKPESGTMWGINFFRNSSKPERSCWSPGLKNFIDPKDFGHIIFAKENIQPVRFLKIHPFAIGINHLKFDSHHQFHYSIKGQEPSGKSVFVKEGKIPRDGKVSLFIDKDRTQQVGITLFDQNGKTLAKCQYPMMSPYVSAKIKLLKKKCEEIDDALSSFPIGARQKAGALMKNLKPLIHDAVGTIDDHKRYTPENWKYLDQISKMLERRLCGVWSYQQTLANFPHADFGVGQETSMRKVMIRDFPFNGRFGNCKTVSLAQNEHEGFQIAVIPFHRDLKDVTVSVSPLRSRKKSNNRHAINTEVSLVGHVNVADNPPYDAEYHGWWPDPLLNFQNQCDIYMGEKVAFWIDVSTRPETLPGLYDGSITITADNCDPVSIPLTVKVWDFKLSDGTQLRNAFTYDKPRVVSLYGDRWNRQLAYKYYDFILDHRLNIDHLYRKESPDIKLLEYAASRGMNAFNVGGVFKKGSINKTNAKLDRYLSRLKQADLFDFAYVYGFDEVKEERFSEIRKVFGMIHKKYPGLETMTTAIDYSFGKDTGLREVVDIWVPLTDWYDLDEAEQLRAEGKKMWWYICISPHHPYANWFIEYPAIEARLLMGAMSYNYKVDGFLYYQMNMWGDNLKPIYSGPYTKWNPGSYTNKQGLTANGDGSLICPGPNGPLSTIRLENIRDGLEDYDYLYLLEKVVRKVSHLPETAQIRSYLERANRLLAIPDTLLSSLTNYTRDPEVLYDFRAEVAEHILKGKRVIASHQP